MNDRTAATAGSVPLTFEGTVKPWYAVWLWAAAMTDRAGVPPAADAAAWDPETTWERVLIARSIGVGAREVFHVTGAPTTEVHPATLSPLPLAWLHRYLCSELQVLVDFAEGRGYGPLPGEPASIHYGQLEKLSTAGGLNVEDLRRDQAGAQARVMAAMDQWHTAQEAAAGVVLFAVSSVADDLSDAPVLGALGGWVNDYVAAHQPDLFPDPLR